MKIVRADEVSALMADGARANLPLDVHWLEGPFNADRLDVAVVTFASGGATGPHVHIGGQVLIGTRGRGFVEAGGERITFGEGDLVLCEPGEMHVHGADTDAPFSHITVTTRGYRFPDGDA